MSILIEKDTTFIRFISLGSTVDVLEVKDEYIFALRKQQRRFVFRYSVVL